MKQLAQSLGLLGIESPMNGMRMLRARLKRLWKPLLVEGMDGVARGLGVATQLVSDLVGVFAPLAGEKDLATAQGEGLEGERKAASKDSRSASVKGRTKIGRFMLWRIAINYCPVWRGTRKDGRNGYLADVRSHAEARLHDAT